MFLNEVANPATLEITKFKVGLDEDLLEDMIKERNLTLTFNGRTLLSDLDKLRLLVQRKIHDVRNPAVCKFDPDHTRVLYAPRERALYIRFAFLVTQGMKPNLHPSWHDYKLPMTLKAKEQTLGTTTQAGKDPDTINLTRFIYPRKTP